MPIATHCPKCAAKFRLPDELAGRRVKCQKCGGIFQAPAAADQPPVEEEIIQGSLAEEEETPTHEETARRGIQASAKAALPSAAQGEEDQPEPPSRRADRAARDDEGDEFDDGATRRRARDRDRPRRARSGMDPWVLVGIIGGVLLAGGAVLASFLFVNPDPQQVVFRGGAGGGAFVPQQFGNIPPLDPAKFEIAKFAGNVFSVKDTLKPGDPIDPVRRYPCKVYRADFQAGKTYQIDQRSVVIDSHLRLESPQGLQLAQNDDFGEGLNSRIRFTATETGAFRVIVGTHDGRLGEFTLDIREDQGGVNVGMPPPKNVEIPNIKVEPRPVQAVAVAGDAPLVVKETLLPTDPPANGRVSRELQIKLEPATYRFECETSGFRPALVLRDGPAAVHSSIAGAGVTKASFNYTALKNGTFTLFVGAFPRGQGEFTVTVQKTNAGAPVPTSKKKVASLSVTPTNPTETSGELQAGEVKTYRFLAMKTAAYTIEVQSDELAPTLKITPEKGGAAVEVRAKEGEKSIRYEFLPELGGFTQLAISAADRKAGKFTLTIRYGQRAK